MKTALCTVGLGILGILAAEGRPQEPDAKGIEFFEKKVEPLLKAKCYSCHSKEAKKLKGKLRLDTREDMLAGGEEGKVIEPGKPDQSRLYIAITYEKDDLQMPPKEEDRLSKEQLKVFEEWIKMGAPHPRKKAEVDKK